MALNSVKISNHKLFSTVERTVLIDSFHVVDSRKEMSLYYTIAYSLNGTDVSQQFPAHILPLTANNSKSIIVRDDNMQPVQNPQWDGKDPNTQFLTKPAYDYLVQYVSKSVPISLILQTYIQVNDADGYFD